MLKKPAKRVPNKWLECNPRLRPPSKRSAQGALFRSVCPADFPPNKTARTQANCRLRLSAAPPGLPFGVSCPKSSSCVFSRPDGGAGFLASEVSCCSFSRKLVLGCIKTVADPFTIGLKSLSPTKLSTLKKLF